MACVPEGRRRWLRSALTAHAAHVDFVQKLSEVARGSAEVAVVSHELIAAADSTAREDGAVLARRQSGPIRIVIDAPAEARVAYMREGMDLATAPETSAEELGAQIGALLRRARTERDRNPLTGLPGNRALRRRLEETLGRGETVALVMADIDDFKAYNDRHGHLAGDALIGLLAEALREAAGAREAFLAHVGGDDFAAICAPEQAEQLASAARADFKRRNTMGPPGVTIVYTTVGPEETDDLQSVFERLAALRVAARNQHGGAR